MPAEKKVKTITKPGARDSWKTWRRGPSFQVAIDGHNAPIDEPPAVDENGEPILDKDDNPIELLTERPESVEEETAPSSDKPDTPYIRGNYTADLAEPKDKD